MFGTFAYSVICVLRRSHSYCNAGQYITVLVSSHSSVILIHCKFFTWLDVCGLMGMPPVSLVNRTKWLRKNTSSPVHDLFNSTQQLHNKANKYYICYLVCSTNCDCEHGKCVHYLCICDNGYTDNTCKIKGSE